MLRPDFISNSSSPFKSGVQVSLLSPAAKKTIRSIKGQKKLSNPIIQSSLSGVQGVSSEAKSNGPIIPIYPRESRLKGQSGRVDVEVSINNQGKVDTIKILNEIETREIPLLVQSALEATRRAVFTPAATASGPIASVKVLTFVFKLN